MYASHHPCWDAKNRYNLPDQMDMEFAQIANLFSVQPVSKKSEPEYNYRIELRALIAKKKLDSQAIAAQFKLNKNSTNEDYKIAYEYAQTL